MGSRFATDQERGLLQLRHHGGAVKTVLIVEDDPQLLNAMAALVELGGFRVAMAANGLQALRIAREEEPAAIVTDYMMPVMDGGELLRELANDPRLAKVPVVLATALAAPPMEVPTAAYLRKPFAAARLLELLRQHTA